MPDPGGGGAVDARLALTVSVKATLRPGAQFGAPKSWPRMARRVVAPYGEVLQTALRPYGVAVNPLPAAMATGWQMESVTYFYARSAS